MKLRQLIEDFGGRLDRSKEISKEEAQKLIATKCVTTGTPIYRSISGFKADFGFVEPAKYDRKARNMPNYVIEIMNQSKYWSAFPKRSKSIVCSLGKITHTPFNGISYRVYPFKNAKFGICSTMDFWDAFNELDRRDLDVSSVGFCLKALLQDTKSKSIFDITVESIRNIENGTNRWASDNILIQPLLNDHTNEKFIFQIIEKWLNPKKNDIFVKKAPLSDFQGECWTDSACVLVQDSSTDYDIW